MASLRAVTRELGVPYSWAYRRLERLLGVMPGLLTRMNNSRPSIIHDGYVDSVISAILVLERRKLAYYTLPPLPLWPWILVNVKQLAVLAGLLGEMDRLGVRPYEVILDVGVFDYLAGGRRDFDEEFWSRLWRSVDTLRELARQYGFAYRVVMPDYPAVVEDNVSRTIRLQEKLLEQDSSIPWLPVAQMPRSGDHTAHLRWLIETGIVKRYGRVALGSLKTLGRDLRGVAERIAKARKLLNEYNVPARLHAFGIQLNIAVSSRDWLSPGSWDSTSWTYPRGPGMWSAKDHEERIIYFKVYLDRLVKLLR